MTENITLKVQGVNHWFGGLDAPIKRVLYNINTEILRGQFVSLVGPSGCGKSTLLRGFLGTHPPKEGMIFAEDIQITHPSRDVGIVYQNYSLYDFLTAEENIAFGPMLDQTTITQRSCMPWKWWPLRKKLIEEAKELLVKLDLERAIGAYPNKLSGGMRQRVAIGQALVMKPKVLLLDEPFGALDESTREELQKMVLQLRQDNLAAVARGEEAITIVLVTHELNEAFYLAERVIGLTQFWDNFNGKSGKEFGATICYDQASPIYHPEDPRDFEKFVHLKHQLREAVFCEGSREKNIPGKFLTFWDDYRASI